jgi:hypothetical protein
MAVSGVDFASYLLELGASSRRLPARLDFHGHAESRTFTFTRRLPSCGISRRPRRQPIVTSTTVPAAEAIPAICQVLSRSRSTVTPSTTGMTG